MLALLVGCGLRRGELLALTMRSVQMREEHWVIADLHGKAGHIRTVPIPLWVNEAVDNWTFASEITDGRIFRSINKAGRIWGDGMTPKVIWEIVKQAAKAAGIEKLAPHDLRRYAACGIGDVHALDCVILRAASLTKFNSFSDTSPFKPPSITLDASRSCASRSTTRLG